jgi:hypothetical protein
MNRSPAHIFGPELIWALLFLAASLLVAQNRPPTEAGGARLESLLWLFALGGVLVSFVPLAWTTSNSWWMLLRIAVVGIIGLCVVVTRLCCGIDYGDSRNSGVGSAFVMMIAFGLVLLLIGSCRCSCVDSFQNAHGSLVNEAFALILHLYRFGHWRRHSAVPLGAAGNADRAAGVTRIQPLRMERPAGMHPAAFGAFIRACNNAGIHPWRIGQTLGDHPRSVGYHKRDGVTTLRGERIEYSAAADLGTWDLDDARIRRFVEALAQQGFAAFYRSGPKWKGNEHIHAIYTQLPMKPQLRRQVRQFLRERRYSGKPRLKWEQKLRRQWRTRYGGAAIELGSNLHTWPRYCCWPSSGGSLSTRTAHGSALFN